MSPPPPTAPRATALALLLVGLGSLATGACGRAEEGPGWTRVAGLLDRAAVPLRVRRWPLPRDPDRSIALVPAADGRGAWLELELARGDWEPTPSPDVWSAPVPLPRAGAPPDGAAPLRLVAEEPDGEHELVFVPPLPPESPGAAPSPEPGTFTAVLSSVWLVVAPGAEPPARARFGAWCTRADGAEEALSVTLGELTASGFPVWPGERVELELDVSPGACLSLQTLGLGAPLPDHVEQGELVFRVRRDGELVLETRQPLASTVRRGFHRVMLSAPDDERARSRFAFEVEGPAALAAFGCPVIGPAALGSFDARPWIDGGADERPNVLVFLADTFRADNLALYGGDPGLTPNLNAFAEESVCFRRAWSTSSWTLPAHASLFTGLWPHQHGAIDRTRRLPDELPTVAGVFRAAGYRTGAITDGVFVSPSYGLDAGFETFDSAHGDLARTLARLERFLAADDGRPFFLFLQTYETHVPYEVSARTRAEHADWLGDAPSFRDLQDRFLAAAAEGTPAGEERCTELLPEYRRLYRGEAADLDRGFGRALELLRAAGALDELVLVFTSDHGEALGEGGLWFHGNGAREPLGRVPLLVRAPGLAPREVELAASLIDLPRTLAALAGLAPAPDWGGANLLALDRERPLYAFQNGSSGQSEMSVFAADFKLILPERPGAPDVAPLFAFDLERDPWEETDVLAEEGERVESLLQCYAAERGDLFRSAADPAGAHLTAKESRLIDQLGYAGE